ncbi:MAG: hypothetical protein CM1200mP22_33080 [Dehalococcoidia bacterium]|nr:MAG: hypothetical protein CM1200mP22_33080 [Dehalococcoidia bacterium]
MELICQMPFLFKGFFEPCLNSKVFFIKINTYWGRDLIWMHDWTKTKVFLKPEPPKFLERFF